MDKKIIITIIITLIIAGGGGFYGGIKYANSKNKMPNFSRNGNFPGGIGQQGQNKNRQGGGMANGEIIKSDDKSITVKANDNNTKIVYFSASTTVSKFAEGSKSDLNVGDNVMVNGTSNSDGSIMAQMVQLRPKMKAEQRSQTIQ